MRYETIATVYIRKVAPDVFCDRLAELIVDPAMARWVLGTAEKMLSDALTDDRVRVSRIVAA